MTRRHTEPDRRERTEHPPETDWILLHYGEAEEPGRLLRHLDGCVECRAERAGVARTLELVDREDRHLPDGPSGAELWAKLEPAIAGRDLRPVRYWTASRALATVGAAAATIAGAFFVGDWMRERFQPAGDLVVIPHAARERAVVADVDEHLDSAHRLMVEVANDAPRGAAAVEGFRRRAESLAVANRLYRHAAQDPSLTEILEDVEPILIELSNVADDAPEGLAPVRVLVERPGLLTRVRWAADGGVRDPRRGGPTPSVPDGRTP